MLKIALAGNPNSGKTTLFNALTGSTAHVGNWPGVTVDKKVGVYKKGKAGAEIVDLPGIYSLSPYTPEEVVTRNYLLDGKPDCIINIVDVTNLERNLYLTTQLMEVDIPLVVALNMTDVLEKNGDSIDVEKLRENIGLPVVKISALRDWGTEELMELVLEATAKKREATSVLRRGGIGKAIANAENALRLKDVDSPLFHAIKLVEKDELEVQMHPREAIAVDEFVKINYSLDSQFGLDTEAAIADARYKYITENYSIALKRSKKHNQGLTSSDKADRVLTNRFAAIPIFFLILFGIFHLTFSENFLYLGSIIPPLGDWCAKMSETTFGCILFSAEGINTPGTILFYAMDLLTSSVGEWLGLGLEGVGASPAIQALLCDGIWGGISSVLSFVPQIMVLFLFFSILEDSGYMARVAFILDRILRRFGVSGRAFMPMIMGFGCSIPAMMNTRTLADEKERTATLRVIPFFSCGAKLPILTAIAGAIVMQSGKGNADIITYSMYLIGILTAVIALLVMRTTTMRGETPPFIMELPTYHFPRFKNLMLHLWDKLKHYIKKAFTIILVSCVVIWFLSNFSWNWEFLMDEYYVYPDGSFVLLSDLPTGQVLAEENIVFMNARMDESILGSLGMFMQFLFTPLGFGSQLTSAGWVFAVAAVTGLIAKENVIATFGALAACLGGVVVASEGGDAEVVSMITATGITVPALLAFIVFNMTTIPCFAAVAAAKGELKEGTFKWTLLFWVVASYIAASAVYTVGQFPWTLSIWLPAALLIGLGIFIYNKKMKAKEAKARLLHK